MNIRKRFICIDCIKDTGKIAKFYMLRDEVWALTGLGTTGMLCIGCAEGRIGRKLVKLDFNLSYLNTMPMARSMRLSDRLKS